MNKKQVFSQSAMMIELSQADMAKAVEYWLNAEVMKFPIEVTGLTKITPKTSAIFRVVMLEKPEPITGGMAPVEYHKS